MPVVRMEHAYGNADVALSMALPWMHELAMPSNHWDSLLGPRTCYYVAEPAALGYQPGLVGYQLPKVAVSTVARGPLPSSCDMSPSSAIAQSASQSSILWPGDSRQ